jgi:hypothetical protein
MLKAMAKNMFNILLMFAIMLELSYWYTLIANRYYIDKFAPAGYLANAPTTCPNTLVCTLSFIYVIPGDGKLIVIVNMSNLKGAFSKYYSNYVMDDWDNSIDVRNGFWIFVDVLYYFLLNMIILNLVTGYIVDAFMGMFFGT